jgi:hypothetical protein
LPVFTWAGRFFEEYRLLSLSPTIFDNSSSLALSLPKRYLLVDDLPFLLV